jgi:outer membrane protein TolC
VSRHTLDSARRSFRLADAGYRRGITDFLNVLAAQDESSRQEQSLAAIRAERIDAWVLLIKELGGGFTSVSRDHATKGEGDASGD